MAVEYEDIRPVDFIGGENECDSNGEHLLSHCQHLVATNNHFIVSMFLRRTPRVVDKVGDHVTDVGTMGYQDDEFNMSAGMAVHENRLLVTDVNDGKILVFDKNTFRFITSVRNTFQRPTCITSTGDMVLVGDLGTRSMHVLDPEMRETCVVDRVGGRSLTGVDNISCDLLNKRVLLTDREADEVHVLSYNGVYHHTISQNIRSPCGTATDRHGNVLVCNMADGVNVYDVSGKYVSSFGRKYLFTRPVDVCVVRGGDRRGDLDGLQQVVVLDGSVYAGWSRLQIFKY